jgi:bla regulator protein BlaR1
MTMASIASVLAIIGVNSPVIDKTALGGEFDFSLQWSLGISATPDGGSDLPPLLTAVKEQLGLKLEPTLAPVYVLVIDHIEQPTAD